MKFLATSATFTLLLVYCIFILSVISPGDTGLKVLSDLSQMYKYSVSSLVTDIILTERQRIRDDHSSMSLRFFRMPLGIGSKDRGQQFEVVIQAIKYLPITGIEPMSCVPRACITHQATVALQAVIFSIIL